MRACDEKVKNMKWLKGDNFFCKCQVKTFLWDSLEMEGSAVYLNFKVVAFGGRGGVWWFVPGTFDVHGSVIVRCFLLDRG